MSPLVEHEVRIPMRTLLEPSIRSFVLKILASVGAVLLLSGDALAGPQKTVKVTASGQIVSRAPCPDTAELCQDVQVTGIATVLGRVTGVLSDRVDPFGHYTGTGVFTTADGSTITTEFEGQVIPNQDGTASFMETHTIVDGTGQYENASGELDLTGTADAFGHLDVQGTGTFIKG
jgi:hypothetical protein